MARTLRNKKLRSLLYYAQDGKCAICGEELTDDWHADHITPWAKTGRTNVHDMQAVCPACNQAKGTKMLRKHQLEMQEVASLIRRGDNNTNILVLATPGSGKSALPIILAKELAEPEDLHICWVVPRDALKKQGERAFVSSFMRNLIGHKSKIRAAGNDIRPSRETQGYITTYQAIAANPQLHADEFRLRNYILVLDECHHIPYKGGTSEEAAYYGAIEPLVNSAKVCVFASGTLERHDGERIAFIPYIRYVNGETPSLADESGWHFIRYSRKDALEEQAVVPLHFRIMDGRARWFDPRTGEELQVNSIAQSAAREQSAVLNTILETDYAHDLIEKCLTHWKDHKQYSYNPAKMLVIAPSIKVAKSYLKHIQNNGYSAAIATSEDGAQAQANIARFKSVGKTAYAIDILVTVGMAYEGLDVPQITHVACLTNIRSRPWIEQAICRANRVDTNKTHGYIFVPDDPRMTAIMKKIEAEQAAVVLVNPRPSVKQKSGGDYEIIRPEPLSGHATRSRAHGMEDGTAANYGETAAIETTMEQVGMKGISVIQAKQFLVMMGAGVVPNSDEPPDYNEDVTTPSEVEANLKRSIKRTVGRIAKGDGDQMAEINREIMKRFGPRDQATISTLRLILRWLDDTYGGIRA